MDSIQTHGVILIYFFTDLQTEASDYCLLNINKYHDKRKERKKLLFVDPGVMELKKATEYKHIEFLHELAQCKLLPNEYLSIDYPADMINRTLPKDHYNALCKLFVEKSIANNWKYAENLHYICAIQSYWMAIDDFYFRMKELEPIYVGKKKIVALGNLCRLLIDRKQMNHTSAEYKYMKQVVDYIIRNRQKFYWIHIYGMSLYAIKQFMPLLQNYAPNIIFSVDSTKWTKVCNKKLHAKYVKSKSQSQLFQTNYKQSGIGCTTTNRNEFFLECMHELEHKNIKVNY